MDMQRCEWAGNDPLYTDYHDNEWGREIRDSRELFELLCLEGQQAGLSWFTILKRRVGMREVFDGFDPEKLSQWSEEQIDTATLDVRVIRHRLKVAAVVKNAKAFLSLQNTSTAFSDWIWKFAPANRHAYRGMRTVTCPESDAMAKALKKAGFTFCGSTICYAFMQACGMVDDHGSNCFRYSR